MDSGLICFVTRNTVQMLDRETIDVEIFTDLIDHTGGVVQVECDGICHAEIYISNLVRSLEKCRPKVLTGTCTLTYLLNRMGMLEFRAPTMRRMYRWLKKGKGVFVR